MIRIAREGFLLIGASVSMSVLFTAAGMLLSGWTAVVSTVLAFIFVAVTAFLTYFFRDPRRECPDGDDIIVSPADGRVIDISKIGESISVKIFMSPLNVHIQRAPVSGVVESVEYTPGKFGVAYDPEAGSKNERNSIRIVDHKLREYEVLQIAGILARRISCRVKPGEKVIRGQPIGMIMFGSQVNLRIPSETRLQVKTGDRVKACSIVIGRIAQ